MFVKSSDGGYTWTVIFSLDMYDIIPIGWDNLLFSDAHSMYILTNQIVSETYAGNETLYKSGTSITNLMFLEELAQIPFKSSDLGTSNYIIVTLKDKAVLMGNPYYHDGVVLTKFEKVFPLKKIRIR